jgi:hypothetical protein
VLHRAAEHITAALDIVHYAASLQWLGKLMGFQCANTLSIHAHALSS